MVLLQRLITHCCESSAGWFVFNFSRPSGGRRRDWDQVGCYKFYSTPYLLYLNVTCGMADISHGITKDMIEPWTQIRCDCWCIRVIGVGFSSNWQGKIQLWSHSTVCTYCCLFVHSAFDVTGHLGNRWSIFPFFNPTT